MVLFDNNLLVYQLFYIFDSARTSHNLAIFSQPLTYIQYITKDFSDIDTSLTKYANNVHSIE